jgi:hypothetical protein
MRVLWIELRASERLPGRALATKTSQSTLLVAEEFQYWFQRVQMLEVSRNKSSPSLSLPPVKFLTGTSRHEVEIPTF